MSARIAVVGSLNVDLVARAPRLPAPGETVIGGELMRFPGGKGANQAVAAARLGGRVSMIGCVGDDEHGDLLLESLRAAGVDGGRVRRDPGAASGAAIVAVDERGENAIVVAPGANLRLVPVDVAAAEEEMAGAAVLLLQLEVPLETVIAAARLGRRRGVAVVLDPAPARPLPDELLASVDVLVPNETEAEALTGISPDDPAAQQAAAKRLRERGVGAVVLTLGARGAYLGAPDGTTARVPAFEVAAVDTTAAGDAFVGGLAVALAEGRPLAEAVRWGGAAGALAATRPGAQPSLPSRAEVESLLGDGPS